MCTSFKPNFDNSYFDWIFIKMLFPIKNTCGQHNSLQHISK